MIKNYLELSKIEVERLVEFMNRNRKTKLYFKDIDEQFKSEEYDFGRGIILKVFGESIIGRVSVILKECRIKGVAYVINLEIKDGVADKKLVAFELIDEVKSIARKYGAEKTYFGTSDEEIIKILNSRKIYKQYSSLRMTLNDRKTRYLPLNLIKLAENNKKEYLFINNDAFREVPNGSTLSEGEVEEYIKKSDENNCCFIATMNKDNIGFLKFNIENGVGEFDLGLVKTVRGKGYGKKLLETAISFLNSKQVAEISLIVITKNTLAYDMYKKRGFKESKLISDWFELQIDI